MSRCSARRWCYGVAKVNTGSAAASKQASSRLAVHYKLVSNLRPHKRLAGQHMGTLPAANPKLNKLVCVLACSLSDYRAAAAAVHLHGWLAVVHCVVTVCWTVAMCCAVLTWLSCISDAWCCGLRASSVVYCQAATHVLCIISTADSDGCLICRCRSSYGVYCNRSIAIICPGSAVTRDQADAIERGFAI